MAKLMSFWRSRRERTAAVVTVLLVTIHTLAGSTTTATAPTVFVANGQAVGLDEMFALGARASKGEYLAVSSAAKEDGLKYRQHTASTIVLASAAIDDGDFHVSSRLRLVREYQTINPLLLSFKIGTHYYDWEITNGSITYLGRMLDAVTYELAKDSKPAQLPPRDEPILLEIEREHDRVKIVCGGKVLNISNAAGSLHGDIAIEVSCAEAEKSLSQSANSRTELRI